MERNRFGRAINNWIHIYNVLFSVSVRLFMGYLYSSVCLVMIFSFLNSSNKSLFYEKFKAIVVVKLHENMNLYSPKNTPACLLHFIFIIELRAIFVSQIDRSIRNCLPSTLYHKTRITKNQRNEQFSELIHLPTFRKH